MKKITLLVVVILVTINNLHSQSDKESPPMSGKRFFAGISYSYMSIDMKLSSMALHSDWYDTDLGTHELTTDEIDEINAIIDRNTNINYFSIAAGMKFIDKPDSKWFFNGKVNLGIAGTVAEVQNTETDSTEYKFDSDISKLCLGLGFDVGYRFDQHWGVSLQPRVLGSVSKTSEIKDMVNPDPINFTADKEDKNRVLYVRGDLLASYTTGPVSLYLGPGFYYCWSKHEYSREYTNVDNGAVLTEEINSTIVPSMFVDASVAVEWRIIEALSLNVHAGVGNDLIVDAGIHFNF